MDWLRRNWPDLLIGIALVAVIAGIIATLITGGSFFSIGQPQTATTPSPPAATAPATVAPDIAQPVVVADPDVAADPQVEAPVVVVPDVAADPDPEPAATGPTVAVLPPSGNAAPVADPVVEAPAPEPTVEATPVAPVAAPVATELPAPSADTEAPFRVSVGAFSTLENAERQAQSFRDAGYPVLIGAQGNLSLVLVGPYERRSDAETAAAQIEAAGLVEEPLIYTFEPDDDTVETGVEATTATAAPTQAAPAVATVSQEGRLIQVGAYGSRESAQPQIDLLSGLGFVVDSRSEGGLFKLLIGPFSGERLGEVQTTLDAAGIAHFLR